MKMNKTAAFEVGQLAERLAQGYYAHAAAIEVAKEPRARMLVSSIASGHPVPVSYVNRKDGTQHVFDFHYYLEQARTNPAIVNDLARIWLVGSLLTVGDRLSRHRYFDHAPELELLYHLRNGVAHGNVFNMTADGRNRLTKHPAHNKQALVRSDAKTEFEIVVSLQGQPILFDFLGPGDVLDLLQSVGVHLMRMG